MSTYLNLNESHYVVTNSNYTKEEETVSFDFESGSCIRRAGLFRAGTGSFANVTRFLFSARVARSVIRAIFRGTGISRWNGIVRERQTLFVFLHALRAGLFTRFFGGTGISRGTIWSGRRPRSVRPDGLSTSACEHSPTRTEISCSDWDDPEFCSPFRTPKKSL